jgi:hypothetical protein
MVKDSLLKNLGKALLFSSLITSINAYAAIADARPAPLSMREVEEAAPLVEHVRLYATASSIRKNRLKNISYGVRTSSLMLQGKCYNDPSSRLCSGRSL